MVEPDQVNVCSFHRDSWYSYSHQQLALVVLPGRVVHFGKKDSLEQHSGLVLEIRNICCDSNGIVVIEGVI